MCLFVSSQLWGEDPGWEARLLTIILLVIQDRKVLLVDDDSGNIIPSCFLSALGRRLWVGA